MSNRSLDIDALRAFVFIAETMSFSRAAERVCLSQAAVSLQISRLERDLGRSLMLRRRGRLMGITEQGEALLPYARRILQLNDEACRMVAVAGGIAESAEEPGGLIPS
jgi:DNA-binding transcriptional LysR family regulator